MIRIAEPRQRLSQSNDSSPHLTWILTFAVMICPVHRALGASIGHPSVYTGNAEADGYASMYVRAAVNGARGMGRVAHRAQYCREDFTITALA